MKNGREWKPKEKKIIKSSIVTEEAAMITELSRLKSHAHHYRWSSTCCSAFVRIALVQLIAALQTCLRMDCLPAAVNHLTLFVAVGTVIIINNNGLWSIPNVIALNPSLNKEHVYAPADFQTLVRYWTNPRLVGSHYWLENWGRDLY